MESQLFLLLETEKVTLNLTQVLSQKIIIDFKPEMRIKYSTHRRYHIFHNKCLYCYRITQHIVRRVLQNVNNMRQISSSTAEKNMPEYGFFPTFAFLTHFSPVSHFYTPWKRQKTFGFLTFSGGIEMWHWTKMG